MDTDMLWPAQGDALFVDREQSATSAHIMRTSRLSWISMAEGYARVAEIAVENSDRLERNNIVYPVVFCYRHAVELYLKFAINVAGRLFRVPVKSTGHRLLPLWFELRPLIDRHWRNGSTEDLVATEAMINEFDEVDRNAQRYRYPFDLHDVPSFSSDGGNDLATYCRSGRKILNFLSGCSDGMSEAIDAQER